MGSSSHSGVVQNGPHLFTVVPESEWDLMDMDWRDWQSNYPTSLVPKIIKHHPPPSTSSLKINSVRYLIVWNADHVDSSHVQLHGISM